MINLEFHAERMWQGLQLSRFHVHKKEVERVLQPILQEVYDFAFQRGVADSSNNILTSRDDVDVIVKKEPEPLPVGTINASIELVHHEPTGSEDPELAEEV